MRQAVRIVVAVGILLGVTACDKCGNVTFGLPRPSSSADVKPQG